MITRLQVRDLALSRGERRLFAALAFELEAGEALALTGPNGAGKTSLLRAIAGFIRPTAGRISFGGDAGDLEPDEARRQDTHLVGHADGLKGGRSAREELGFQVAWTGGDETAGLAAAQRLGLTRSLDLAVRHLSAGQRRRLALARLLASPRRLWLLDEPLSPLDAAHRALFADVMGEHLAGGGLIVAASHDPLPIPARSLELAA